MGKGVRVRLADEIEVARAIVPSLAHIALVGDRWDSQTLYRHWEGEIASATKGLDVIDLTGLPMREIQKRVADLPPTTAIIYSAIYSDGEGNYFPPADSIALVAQTANRPIVVAAETFVGRGGIGGQILIPAGIGREAAESALRVLDGQQFRPRAETEQAARLVFDWRQLRRWGVPESRLPPNSEIRFRDPSVWDRIARRFC
jgi:ABC-type uncharacterized transport system substrate-binding protein